METPSISNFDNHNWNTALVTSLYSTIEFLKNEIHIKNDIISKLLDRSIHCTHNDTSNNVNNNNADDSTSNDNHHTINSGHGVITQNPNGNRIDERNITSRTKQRQDRIYNKSDADTDIFVEENVENLKSVTIIGDSTLNNINPRGISKNGNVKISVHPGATSVDMKDYINPTIRRKPDVLIIHVGTNDLNTEIDTVANLQTTINRVKKKSSETKIIISSLLMRHDQKNIEEKVLQLNRDIKKLCEENLIDYICNKNIDNSCLGKGKLHPNKKGKAYLAKTFISYINGLN